jgi:hypothetical protein
MVQHTCDMNNDFKTWLRIFFDLCLIKKSPKDVPESRVLLKTVFFAYFLAGVTLLSSSMDWADAIGQSFIESCLVGLFVYMLTSFFSVPNRFVQSVTAVYGSSALITFFSVPFIYWVENLSRNDEPTGAGGLVVFLIVCWSFVVMANIIRETIQKSFGISLLLTFCYLYLSYQVISLVYPIAGS